MINYKKHISGVNLESNASSINYHHLVGKLWHKYSSFIIYKYLFHFQFLTRLRTICCVTLREWIEGEIEIVLNYAELRLYQRAQLLINTASSSRTA